MALRNQKDFVNKEVIIPAQIFFCLQEKNEQSIYNLWKTFKNEQVAESCGQLWIYLLNPVVGAQIFECEISNILIKPMESIFGYIPSLPRNFYPYQYSALLDSTNNAKEISNNSNILINHNYLAKNNVICFELISKCNFFLGYYIMKVISSGIKSTEKLSE
ncbi:29900_t:CDS:2 [Gigaspora margarita]|uniref:Chitin synthase n=1 Tax=Gigaspora margarita TaxID=4874 RepID=A0ABN7UZ43_GIGMA|nr:29900_t:CDS:2 [Gigaspora margarita]